MLALGLLAMAKAAQRYTPTSVSSDALASQSERMSPKCVEPRSKTRESNSASRRPRTASSICANPPALTIAASIRALSAACVARAWRESMALRDETAPAYALRSAREAACAALVVMVRRDRASWRVEWIS